MNLRSYTSLQIGEWTVLPNQNRIVSDSGVTKIEPKIMEVLLCLANRQGRVVSRDELLESVWAGTVVTDEVVTRAISELRKAFGEDRKQPGVIETIPKSGYRLIAPVSFRDRLDRQDITSASTSVTSRRRRDTILLGATAAIVLLFVSVLALRTEQAPAHFHAVPETSTPEREGGPSLSSDGRRIVFARDNPDGGSSIYVKLVGREQELRLTDSPDVFDHHPVWSHDDAQVAFMRSSAEAGCNILAVSSLGGTPTRFAPCRQTVYGDLAWSPDGKWLAFNDRASNDESFGIHLLNVSTRERHRITKTSPTFWGDHDPAFSPDGARLSFTRSVSEGIQDVFVIGIDGTNELRVSQDGVNVYGHDWTSRSALIVSSNRSGRFGLWRYGVGGGIPTWAGVEGGEATFPVLRGETLAYKSDQLRSNLHEVDVDSTPGATRPVVPANGWTLHPAISPDGKSIAYTSNRSGHFEIWTSKLDGTEQTQITNFAGPFVSTPRWSPDGSEIVFTGRSNGQADIYLVKLAERIQKRLTEEPYDELAASWSNDGSAIYYTANVAGAWRVMRMNKDGEMAEDTGVVGFGPIESLGGQLYVTRPGQDGLWTSLPGSDSLQVVVPEMCHCDWGSWAMHGTSLYYVRRDSSTQVVRVSMPSGSSTMTNERLDQTTTDPQVVFRAPAGIPRLDPALAISPDGMMLIVGLPGRADSDIMRVDGFRR